MSQYASIASPTENARVELSADSGATWQFIPGTASVTESGGESPTREQVTFTGVNQITGKARPPTVEFSIAGYAAAHAVHQLLKARKESGALTHFRYTFEEQELQAVTGAPNTVAIATTGVVTFAGDSPDFTEAQFGPGVAIKVGSKYYVVDTISSSGAVKVAPAPNAAVSATASYSIVVPGLQRPSFPARIQTFDNISADSESQVATTLSVAPIASLPALVIAGAS